MEPVTIAIIDKEQKVHFTYQASVVPHIGECIYLPHKGTFSVIQVIHNISDDAPIDEPNFLMFVNVVIDIDAPIVYQKFEEKEYGICV